MWTPPVDEIVKTDTTGSPAAGGWAPPADEVVQPSTMDKVKEFAGNLGNNALEYINPVTIAKGLGETAKVGLHDLPRDIAKSSVQVLQSGAKAIAGTGTPSDVGQAVLDSPIIQRTKAMTEPIAKDPAGYAFKYPIDAASLLLAPVLPFLGEGGAAATASKAIESGAAPEVGLGGTIKGIAKKAWTALDAVPDLPAGGMQTKPAPKPPAGPSLGRKLVAKTISATLGAPEEAILARMENPAGVKTAFSHPELADQMTNSVKNLRDQVGQLDTKAYDTLSTSPFIEPTKGDVGRAVPKEVIGNAIKAARRDLGGVFSQDAEAASGALKNVVEYYKKLRNTVSETQVKDLIQQLDSDINWDNPNASRTNEALAGVRTRLDGILKSQNEDYRQAMIPVAEGSDLIDEMQKKFGIQKKTGKGYQVTDQTVNKIKSSLKEDRLGTMNVLDRFQRLTGEDFVSKIKNANVNHAFTGEKTQGSRRAVLGTTLGGAAGYLTGAPWPLTSAAGSIVGIFADMYGRKIAGHLADALSMPEMRRYIPAFQKAALSGPKKVALLHAQLLQHDPDYTQAMTDAVHSSISGNGKKQ